MLDIHTSIDVSGLKCPMHVLIVNKLIGKLDVGQVLEIVVTEPWNRCDIANWIKKTGHEKLLEINSRKDHTSYLVRKIS
ncbi:MAG: sulfurtransferase TusA family protein [Candidatus Odinarchaeota archaeon]